MAQVLIFIVIIGILTLGVLIYLAIRLSKDTDKELIDQDKWANAGLRFSKKQHINGTLIAMDELFEKLVIVDSKLNGFSAIINFSDIIKVDILINGVSIERKARKMKEKRSFKNPIGAFVSRYSEAALFSYGAKSVELKITVKNNPVPAFRIPFNVAGPISKSIKTAQHWKDILSVIAIRHRIGEQPNNTSGLLQTDTDIYF